MKAFSPVMVQYQHPYSLLGMPPLVLISIVFLAVMTGFMVGFFTNIPIAFMTVLIVSLSMFVAFKRAAKNDRHAEKVYLSGLFYWMSKQSRYLAGVGR